MKACADLLLQVMDRLQGRTDHLRLRRIPDDDAVACVF